MSLRRRCLRLRHHRQRRFLRASPLLRLRLFLPALRRPQFGPSSEISVPTNAKVLYTEVGYASWYGPGFQKRNAANGQPYDMNAMTAAHRTLPLNTIARVTDVKTGDSVLLRITDRGPFVGDRVIDLSRPLPAG